jgi:hypothetical protein
VDSSWGIFETTNVSERWRTCCGSSSLGTVCDSIE